MLVLILFFFASPPGRRALVNRTIGPLLTIWWETLVFHNSFPLPIAASPLCPLQHQIHCCSHPNALRSTGDNRISCCNQVGFFVCKWTPFRGLPVSAERCGKCSMPNSADVVDHLNCRVLFLLLVWGTPPLVMQVIRKLIFQETVERMGERSVSRRCTGPGCSRKDLTALLHHRPDSCLPSPPC